MNVGSCAAAPAPTSASASPKNLRLVGGSLLKHTSINDIEMLPQQPRPKAQYPNPDRMSTPSPNPALVSRSGHQPMSTLAPMTAQQAHLGSVPRPASSSAA